MYPQKTAANLNRVWIHSLAKIFTNGSLILEWNMNPMILLFNSHIYFLFNQVSPIEIAELYKAELVKEWWQHKKLTASNRKKNNHLKQMDNLDYVDFSRFKND